MLVIKKTFPSYTSRWIPEGTDNMFIFHIRLLLQNAGDQEDFQSQATPPGGYLKAQIACSFHIRLLLQNASAQIRLSQATPPGGYLKAQITYSFHTRLLLQNAGVQEDFLKLHLQVDTCRHR